MALALIVNLTVQAGNEEKATEFIRQLEENARREPGCRQYIGHQSNENPSRFAFYELYDDKAALDAHCASAPFKQYFTNGLEKLLKTVTVEQFHTV